VAHLRSCGSYYEACNQWFWFWQHPLGHLVHLPREGCQRWWLLVSWLRRQIWNMTI
jgi:hypothetical protein